MLPSWTTDSALHQSRWEHLRKSVRNRSVPDACTAQEAAWRWLLADDARLSGAVLFWGSYPHDVPGGREAVHCSRQVPVLFPCASQVLPVPVGYSTGDVMMDAPRKGEQKLCPLAGVMMPAPVGSLAAVSSRVRETRPSRSRKARLFQSRRRWAVIE